jgi:hypothetical protein
VSLRLGGGAATGHWGTDHQEGERESWSNQTVRLRVLGPDAPVQSLLYRRKAHAEGSPLCGPVRGYPKTFYGLGGLFSVMKFRVGHGAEAMKH